jgi:hypothetical protein
MPDTHATLSLAAIHPFGFGVADYRAFNRNQDITSAMSTTSLFWSIVLKMSFRPVSFESDFCNLWSVPTVM